jgi:hypothetical protein
MGSKQSANRSDRERVKRVLTRICICTASITACATVAAPRATHVDLFPKLQAGQVVTYEVSYRSDKQTKTQSSVVPAAQGPDDAVVDVRVLLRLEILDVASPEARAVIHARATLQSHDYGALSAPRFADPARSESQSPQPQPTALAVEFSILPDGRLDQIKNLDVLSADQRQAWQQWAARFATAGRFPPHGVKPAQRWKSEEPEKSPSPIAGLTWVRESTYVRNAPCRPLRINDHGDFVESDKPPETCAVILTTASLKQQSSTKDATPDDYRVRQLRTVGTARGGNKTIVYISLTTGLVVRATDEADQAMSVTIAKADGSNHVHYDVQAKSAAEILLVTGAPPNP